MTTEIWKDIEGYEGLYQVSNFGRVRSLDRYVEKAVHPGFPPSTVLCKGRILKQGYCRFGYAHVCLTKKGVPNKIARIHRLVARAFVQGYFEGVVVNHKDENPKNNRADNLEWCTQKYNVTYNGASYRARENRRKMVVQMTKDGKEIATFESASEAARQTGIRNGNICAACSGRYKQSHGYIWKYKE